MQILYLLVLGDKSNVLYGKDLCFNANYRFKHEIIDENEVMVSWKIKDILPDNFFTTRENNRNCCIDNVSEIIGVNGSGKTLILKTLLKIATHQFSERYILVYKKDEKLIIRYGFLNEEKNKRVYELDCNSKIISICFKSNNNIKQIGIYQYGLDSVTDLVYLCNHYCSTWEGYNWAGQGVYDYSTANLILKDYDESEFANGDTSRACINSHKYKEIERILKLFIFLREKERENILKKNINNYQESINNISINKVNIEWNKDVLDSAHDIMSTLDAKYKLRFHDFLLRKYFSEKVERTDILNLFEKDDLPLGTDFFFMIFLCLIASWVEKFFRDSYSPSSLVLVVKKLNDYFNLAIRIKQELKKNRKDIYDFKDEIMRELNKESQDLVPFFDKAYNILSIQKKYYKEKNNLSNKDENFDNFVEFCFSDLNSKEEFFNLLKLHLHIVNRCQFYKPLINIKFDPPISSGELSFLTLWARLYDYFEDNLKSKHAIIFIDEAETALHPEWQKALCQNIISFIEDYCEVRKRELHLHIIFASHSPMLMSDIPTGNVIFLDKDNSSDNPINTNWKTFAGDIFEIYQKGFFLKNGSIGNFALSKVDNVIKHISQGNISDDDRKIIDMIGDGLITNYFHRIIDKQSSSANDSQK